MSPYLEDFIARRRRGKRRTPREEDEVKEDETSPPLPTESYQDNKKRLTLISHILTERQNASLSPLLKQELMSVHPSSTHPIGQLEALVKRTNAEINFNKNSSLILDITSKLSSMGQAYPGFEKATVGLPEMLNDPQFKENLKVQLHQVPLLNAMNPQRIVQDTIYGTETRQALPWWMVVGGLLLALIVILVVNNLIRDDDKAKDKNIDWFSKINRVLSKHSPGKEEKKVAPGAPVVSVPSPEPIKPKPYTPSSEAHISF